ncbi:MAG TPA: hypothetical protein DF712_02525 [Balneola sp.]|nr:hypothetical protein [Balneola sp.]
MTSTNIKLRYKGESANVNISWEDEPFSGCVYTFTGANTAIWPYKEELSRLGGYFIQAREPQNIEAHLNAAYAASKYYKGFTYKVTPEVDLFAYLEPEDKDPEVVY